MKKFICTLFTFLITIGAFAQIQTRFWDFTLGESNYKHVNKFCKKLKGEYTNKWEKDLFVSGKHTIENEYNDDPLKGDIFIKPFKLLNFAGENWKVTFSFQDKTLYMIEMALSENDRRCVMTPNGRFVEYYYPTTPLKRPDKEYLDALVSSLLDKYSAYFQPEESKEENSYIYCDGKTICRLQLTKQGYLYLTYIDKTLYDKHSNSLLDEI